MDVDDVLTYASAVDLANKGLLTNEDLETIWDTVIEDPEDAMNVMISLFLGQLDLLGVSWDDLRDRWLSAQERSA